MIVDAIWEEAIRKSVREQVTKFNPNHDELGRFSSGQATDRGFASKYGNKRMQGSGDCFSAAQRTLEQMPNEEQKRSKLCHGVPLGQGEIDGIRFDHAWVERTDHDGDFGVVVIDRSNGKNLELPREVYYALGNIKENDVSRYTYFEAIKQMSEHNNYGPWT